MTHITAQITAHINTAHGTLVAAPFDGRFRFFGWVEVNDPLAAMTFATLADARAAAAAAGRTVTATVVDGVLIEEAT